jgi:two-component system, NtrC family, response regulator AtoC
VSPTILIVDDEKHTREGIRRALEDDFDVYVADGLPGAMSLLETERVDLLLTDLRLGAGEDGMKLIDRALKMPVPPVCIMMTAYGSVDTAVEAMKRGAYDFVTKPINLDKLEILIRRALRSREMETENTALKEQVQKNYGLENIIGHSAVMEAIFATIRQVAPTRATVSISGESGTGKELVAHALHNLSNRAKSKFVAVNCAALAPQLLESELFGHEKGSFTGASERRIGRFEQADGGTLFLDEIAEIDPGTQVKILRVLSERTFERVGGNLSLTADVRLISATNKDLRQLVAEEKFREDLFYRLNVVPIHMPPLRERREDIPLLVAAFLKQSAHENDKPLRELTSEAAGRLMEYPWPGNVRELRAALDHGVVLATGPKITLRDLPSTIRHWHPDDTSAKPGGASAANALRGVATSIPGTLNLEATERLMITQALEQSNGNRTLAAKKLGISRRTLHRKLKEWNLGKPDEV